MNPTTGWFLPCLLYTSDAADERSSVDLGGRRIIKKKNNRDRTCYPSIITVKKNQKHNHTIIKQKYRARNYTKKDI